MLESFRRKSPYICLCPPLSRVYGPYTEGCPRHSTTVTVRASIPDRAYAVLRALDEGRDTGPLKEAQELLDLRLVRMGEHPESHLVVMPAGRVVLHDAGVFRRLVPHPFWTVVRTALEGIVLLLLAWGFWAVIR